MKKAGSIVGATAQVDSRHLGIQAFAELLLVDYYRDNDLMHERFKKETNNFYVFSHPDKGNIEAFALMKDLRELEELKMRLAKLTAGRIVSYIWTGAVKSLPWNLSFGFPTKAKDEVYKSQSQPSVKSTKGEVDEVDNRIIDKLCQNSRMPFSSIAKEMGIATDTVIRRYKALKQNRTINPLIQINPKKLGYNCHMEMRIRLKSQRDSIEVMKFLSEIPDIYFMTATSGDYDLHIFAFIRDIEHLLQIQKQIINSPDYGKLDLQLSSTIGVIFPAKRYWFSTI
jgi:Lrp/AsnC family transcriptional regulator for asnA, asnC and gidA